MNQFGIENIKKLLLFVFAFTDQAFKAGADSKFKWTEIFGFADEIMQIPGVIKALPQIKQEFADLDDTERAELIAYIKEHFDIPDDHLEGMIETGLEVSVNLLGMIEHWKAAKAAQK